MSTTTIHVFRTDGKRDYDADRDFRNGHTAPILWGILWKKYLAKRGSPNDYDPVLRTFIGDDGFESFPMMSEAALKPFWALHNDPRLAWFERLTLRSTYDHVVVRREHFLRIAEAFDIFTATHVAPDRKHVWNVPGYAAYLRELAGDETVMGVGWTQTSVVDMFLSETDPNDEDAEGKPYDLNTRTEHWYMDLEGDEVASTIDPNDLAPGGIDR